MRLDQFDKLKSTCSALVQNYRRQKYQIIRLKKENSELKSKIDLLTEQNDEINLDEFVGLKNENERFVKKSQKVKQRLEKLVGKLENQELQF